MNPIDAAWSVLKTSSVLGAWKEHNPLRRDALDLDMDDRFPNELPPHQDYHDITLDREDRTTVCEQCGKKITFGEIGDYLPTGWRGQFRPYCKECVEVRSNEPPPKPVEEEQ